jgi:uncharacterized protein YecE (DUF72 family)
MAPYFKRFGVVEVQQTFYDPPPIPTLAKWRAQAPPAFEFTMKAWQVITHTGTSPTYRRMKRPFTDSERAEAGGFRKNPTTLAAWNATLDAARALRATAILFQCPASFRPTEQNVAAMREFFSGLTRPGGVRFLWEPRGPWPVSLLRTLCAELRLDHVVDPFIGPAVTPAFTYWRLHGNGSPYASYSDADLETLAALLGAETADERYVMFNNIPRVRDVERFRQVIG